MKTSAKGVAFIAAHEGIVTKAYRDAAGVWTIGVGHTAAAGGLKPVQGMVITRGQALEILASDLPKFETRVDTAMPGIPQTVHDGSTSFDFNTGAIHKATWVKNYMAGNLAAARASLLTWNKAGGKTLAGLVRRRADEQRLIFDGDYGAIDASILGSDAAPSVSKTVDEIKDYQQDLATLGFYHGAIDGIAGPATKAAVLAYQKSHPDLVPDGIVGPATRASLERDIKARSAPAQGAAAAAGASVITAAVVTVADGSNPLAWALGVAAIVAVAVGLVIYFRNRR
jgi:lysozyme